MRENSGISFCINLNIMSGIMRKSLAGVSFTIRLVSKQKLHGNLSIVEVETNEEKVYYLSQSWDRLCNGSDLTVLVHLMSLLQ